jgi:hypothetical protein
MHASPANIAGSRITPVGIKAAAVPTRNRVLTAKTTDFDKLTLLPVKQPSRQKRLAASLRTRQGHTDSLTFPLSCPCFQSLAVFLLPGHNSGAHTILIVVWEEADGSSY